MAQWYIKEFSSMTKVSVRTLHHYDHIGLLKPSVRTSSSYRLYSEEDLAKLQQIIALKFFGFSLEQIKTMLQTKLDLAQHLQVQQQMLQQQAVHLRLAQEAIVAAIDQCKSGDSVDWHDLITLIERYRMAEALKKTWAGKVLNEKQQQRYLDFKQAYPKESDAWEKAIEEVNTLQLGDPEGPDGQRIVKANLAYNKAIKTYEQSQLKAKTTREDVTEMQELIGKWKTDGLPLGREGIAWFFKALMAYWLRAWDHIYQEITNHIDEDPTGPAGEQLAAQWRELLINQCQVTSPELYLGTLLLTDVARYKVAAENSTPSTPAQDHGYGPKMLDYAKLLRDPLAMSWIDKALRTH